MCVNVLGLDYYVIPSKPRRNPHKGLSDRDILMSNPQRQFCLAWNYVIVTFNKYVVFELITLENYHYVAIIQ